MKKTTRLLMLVISSSMLIACGGKGGNSSSLEVSSEPIEDTSDPVGNTTLEGKGTELTPYLIKTKEDLKEFHDNTVLGLEVHYSLEADLEWDGEWSPIGDYDNPFIGGFDGNGHKISGVEITKFSKTQKFYGMFSALNKAHVYDLDLGMTVDLTMLGNGTQYVVGGLAASSVNSSVTNVHINYDKCDIVTAQNNSSYLYVGGIVSYFATEAVNNQVYYAAISRSSVTGNISVDLTDSDDVVDAEGGIVAIMDTGSYEGIMSVSNCAYYGDIRGGIYVGGIAADMATYGSVVNCYVESNTIGSYTSSFSYVGGVVGAGVADSAIYQNYANVAHVVGTKSPSTYYESYAGDVVAAVSYDGYSEGVDSLGTAVYGNWSCEPTVTNADNVKESKDTADYTANLMKKIGFNEKVWNFGEETATIKKDAKDYMVKLTVNLNGAKGEQTVLGLNAGTYNNDQYDLYTNFEAPTLKNHSFFGLFYDADATVEWRWYAPISSDMTIYCGYADLSDLVGDYKPICTYYESEIDGGIWKFTYDRFYWIHNDGSYSEYKYSFNGSYIFIGDYCGQFKASMGAYEGEIFALTKDGKITGFDVNSDSATYSAEKRGTEMELPNIKNAPFLGTWKSSTQCMTIYEDCVVTAYNLEGSQVVYYGGVVYDGTTLTINVLGRINNMELKYNAGTDTLTGSGVTWTRG